MAKTKGIGHHDSQEIKPVFVNSTSNSAALEQPTMTMSLRDKTHMFYLAATMVVLSGILIKTGFSSY